MAVTTSTSGSRKWVEDWAGKRGGEWLDPLGIHESSQVNYEGFDTNADYSGNLQWYGKDWMGDFDAMGQAASGRQIDPAVYAMLAQQATGAAPSAAELQLMAGLQRQQAMAQSMASSNPNISPALAQRMAMQQMSDAGLQTNQQAAALRAQEQAAAQGQLAGYVMQQQGLNDQMTQSYMQQGYSRDEAEMLAAQEKARMELEARAKQAELQLQADQGNAGQLQGEKGAKMGAFGSVLGLFSDRRLKTDISETGDEMEEFINALTSYRFRYKDEKHGEGEHLGIMAQDLEESELGRLLVVEHEDGKAVDIGRASMAALAIAAHLGKRVRELESDR